MIGRYKIGIYVQRNSPDRVRRQKTKSTKITMLIHSSFFAALLVFALVKVASTDISYPEYKERAETARSVHRTALVKHVLADAAGIYKDKTRSREFGVEKTIFISVVSYSEKSYYKIYFYNLLCYAQHHGIDIVVYLVHHNLPDWEKEIEYYNSIGVKMLPYPDELFWSLLYSKTTEIHTGPAGHGDYASKVPSFTSHGALVMLVPVLEVLLNGYNCIFYDVDIAMVLDPIPFLTRGKADFVSSVEMRSCPDTYTPTYLDSSTVRRKHHKTVNSMESINWYTLEPNTGIMSVRATEAGIGFYTKWLLRIIDVNELNDQKAMLREPHFAQYTNECVYGHTHSHHGNPAHGGAAGHVAHRGKLHHMHANNRSGEQRSASVPVRWAEDYHSLMMDVQQERYEQPAKFCFVSELLFQNGQTAFTCGGKPSYRDAWVLEMYRNGLQKHNEDNSLHHNARQVPFDTVGTPRFAVAVHANYCDRKTHELSVRGLWLVQNDSTEINFSATTCRAYDPYQTYYAMHNWTDENHIINKKLTYMTETFVQPGKLIQSKNGREVYYIDERRFRQLIPDGDTFIAMMGEEKWGDVRILPQPLVDAVPLGEPIPSVQAAAKAVTALPPERRGVPAATTTAAAVPMNQAAERATAVRKADQILFPGMVVRGASAPTIYYIDKDRQKRRVQNMALFQRLFGKISDVVTIPDAVLETLPLGEPLLS